MQRDLSNAHGVEVRALTKVNANFVSMGSINDQIFTGGSDKRFYLYQAGGFSKIEL
jgi:hypothetical protein